MTEPTQPARICLKCHHVVTGEVCVYCDTAREAPDLDLIAMIDPAELYQAEPRPLRRRGIWKVLRFWRRRDG